MNSELLERLVTRSDVADTGDRGVDLAGAGVVDREGGVLVEAVDLGPVQSAPVLGLSQELGEGAGCENRVAGFQFHGARSLDRG